MSAASTIDLEPAALRSIYRTRFAGLTEYRNAVWRILIAGFFGRFLPDRPHILDLGCGYGEFINNVPARQRSAMDLNPDARAALNTEIAFFEQDCSAPWPIADGTLDAVFTSNFFEHLPSKAILADTLAQVRRCLRPGGVLIALGPNIRYLSGAYWDFWDHYLPLTHLSLAEGMRLSGFEVAYCLDRFLPYTMATGPRYPLWLLRLYLRLPFAWRVFGKQFVVVGRKV